MDFITWWLEDHYILSTLCTPGFTLLWCIYKDLTLRGIVAFFCLLLTAALRK